MKKKVILGTMTTAVALGLLAAFPAYAEDATIPKGVFVGEMDLGGKTCEEAKEEINSYVSSLFEQKVTFEVEGKTAETTIGALGFAWDNDDAIEEALEEIAEGNLIEQYMKRKDVEKEPLRIPLETTVDQAQVENFVEEQCQGLTTEPQNATITRTDGKFVVTAGVVGKQVDLEATMERVEEALAAPTGEEVTIQAVVISRDPDITEDDLSTIGDLLGTCTTDFSTSGAARSKNLAVGSAKINGRVLMPGETLSGYECMHPFTTENGYYTAAAYEGGKVVDSVGGGVCQIATTLYDAALHAELEITQRQNHSMIVGYVKPSMDAAIAGTYKDIKITNNYSTPIYVEGGVSGKKLTFSIYGKEVRPENRKVEYISETLSVTDPGEPQETLDPSLAPGTRKQVQSAHTGLKSRLWKVVTVDGVETERTIVSTDTYNASKAIVLVGPELPAEETPSQEITEISPTVPAGPGASIGGSDSQTTVPAGPGAGTENQTTNVTPIVPKLD